MTNSPESQSTEPQEETEEQVRERRAKAHAIRTLNNTAVEAVVCLTIPEGKLTPESAKIISDRHYVSLDPESLTSFDVVEQVHHALNRLTADVVAALRDQVREKMMEQAGDGRSQESRGE